MRARAERPGVAAARRVVRKEVARARAVLTEHWPIPDDAIHEARKRLKRARAALRLVRPVIGDRSYRRQNRALRDAARPLSQMRDARVLVETFDRLMKKPWDRARRSLGALHSQLMADPLRLRTQLLPDSKSLDPILERLDAVRRNARRWRGRRAGWPRMRAGLRQVYRSGRDAFAATRERPTVARLHEWRKQAKYLWHVLEIVEPMRPRRISRLALEAHRLSDRLGEDHDLAVLLQRLRRGGRVPKATLTFVTERIDERRKRLQEQATKLGEGLYAERPSAFVATLES